MLHHLLTQLATFAGVSAVLICTPGPDTALTIRNALSGGRRSGVATALGVGAGLAVWSLTAAAGLAAVLRASEPAFLALRIAGSAYLVLLGAQALRAAFARRRSEAPLVPAAPLVTPAWALRQGLISNLGNPKIAVFFTSLLPQFGTSFPALLALGLAFCLLTVTWLAAYAIAVARARRLLARTRVRRVLDALTGAVMVGFGLRLASEHH